MSDDKAENEAAREPKTAEAEGEEPAAEAEETVERDEPAAEEESAETEDEPAAHPTPEAEQAPDAEPIAAAKPPAQHEDEPPSRADEDTAAETAPEDVPAETAPEDPIVDEGPSELFEFRLQICAQDSTGGYVAVHTKSEREDVFPSRNTVKLATKQTYVLVFLVANTRVPFDSLLAVKVGEFDVPITKQLRSNNEFVCEGKWDTSEITPTGDGFRIQMPVRVAYLLGNEKHCRETEFILQMKVYDARDSKKAMQGGTPLDCISCKFYRTSSRTVSYPTFLKN